MSAAPSILALSPSPPPLPPVKQEQEIPLYSPELATLPDLQKEKVDDEAIGRAEKIFSTDFGFFLKEFLCDVLKATLEVGGKIDGCYFKGGVNDHILFGKGLPTTDLDLNIKLDEGADSSFYHKETWRRLKELIFVILRERGIEKDRLKNMYLHFDEKNEEFHFLISFPVIGTLRSIDLQIVLKQKIGCLSSYDAIQIDLMPFLKIERGQKPHALMAKSVGSYLYSESFHLKRAGCFEVLPSARTIRKGFFDLSRKLSLGVIPRRSEMMKDYWLGFQDQYFQEGEGIFGAFEDDLMHYLKDHFNYDSHTQKNLIPLNDEESLGSLFFLLNMDLLICLFCDKKESREALRSIISASAHRLLGQEIPSEKRELIASLDEVEHYCLNRVPGKKVPFIGDRNHSPFTPSFSEFTFLQNRKRFFFHPLLVQNEREVLNDPSTLLGCTLLPRLFPMHFKARAEDEKEAIYRGREMTSASMILARKQFVPERGLDSFVSPVVGIQPDLVKVEPPLTSEALSGSAPVSVGGEKSSDDAPLVAVSIGVYGSVPVAAGVKNSDDAPLVILTIEASGSVPVSAGGKKSSDSYPAVKSEANPGNALARALPPATPEESPVSAAAAQQQVVQCNVPGPMRIIKLKSFNNFLSDFTLEEIAVMKGDELESLGDQLIELFERQHEQFLSLNPAELNSLKALHIQLIRILSLPNRSLENKKNCCSLIGILAADFQDKCAFPLAWDLLVNFRGKNKQEEVSFSLRLYNKLFSSVFEPRLALEMTRFIFAKMEGFSNEKRKEIFGQLLKSFEKFKDFIPFFLHESENILSLHRFLFFEFLKLALRRLERLENENDVEIVFSLLARYEKENKEGRLPLLDFLPRLGIERAKMRERYIKLCGKKKEEVAIVKKVPKKKEEFPIFAIADSLPKDEQRPFLMAEVIRVEETFTLRMTFAIYATIAGLIYTFLWWRRWLNYYRH